MQYIGIDVSKATFVVAYSSDKGGEIRTFNNTDVYKRQLSLGEIADKLNYSSTAHLRAQFKKVTGLTPSHFRTIGENRRKPLDKV